MNREELKSIFDALRNDPQHHLGLGDIRLTIAQQNAILDLFPFKDKPLPPAEGANLITKEELINLIMDHSAGATDNVADGVCYKTLADSILKRLSLPPAEGAEAFLRSHKISGADFVYTTGFENMVELLREFAAQQQPTAEGAEEIDDETIAWAAEHQCGTPFSERWIGFVKGAKWHRSLHAQRIAEKMVEERSEFIKKAVIRFFYTEVDLNFCTREYRDRVEWYFNTYQHEIFKLPKTSLDNFKSREK